MSEDWVAHLQQGNASYEKHELVAAGEHYRRALALQPASLEANYNLGVVLADSRQYDEAATQFRRTLELNPQSAPAWNFLGVCDVAEQVQIVRDQENCRRRSSFHFPDNSIQVTLSRDVHTGRGLIEHQNIGITQ